MAVKRKCVVCEKEFNAKQYHVNKGQARYCSKECFYKECHTKGCKYPDCKNEHFGHGYCKKHYREQPEAKEREKELRKINYPKNREKQLESAKKWHKRMRHELLMHYSNGSLVCAKCGFDDVRALDIDHINGGGCKERKKTMDRWRRTEYTGYIYRLRTKKPEGYQVLCRNCNWIKHLESREIK